MVGTVHRKVLSFPARSQRDAATAVACAVPGDPSVGGAAYAPTDKTIFEPTPNESIASQKWDKSTRRIELAVNGKPVRAISLAPDSPIAECDISLHGDNGEFTRHRISAGNPCLSVGDADFAQITIADSIPQLDGDDTTAIYWDANRTIAPSEDSDYDHIVGWPLRLEFWQGAIEPVRSVRRAAHVAHAVMHATIASPDRQLYVCVSGRRKVSVIVDSTLGGSGDSIAVRCRAIGGWKDLAGGAATPAEDIEGHSLYLPLNPAGDTTLTLDFTTIKTIMIEMDALSRPILCVELVATLDDEGSGECYAQVHVRAED